MYKFHNAVLSVVPEFYKQAFAIDNKEVICELFKSVFSQQYNNSLRV